MGSCNFLRVCFGHVKASRKSGQKLDFQRGEMTPNTSSSVQDRHENLQAQRSSEVRHQSETAEFSQHEEDVIDTGIATVRMSLDCDKGAINASTVPSDKQLRVINTVQSRERKSACGSVLHSENSLAAAGESNDIAVSIRGSSSQESNDCGQRGRHFKRTKSILLRKFVAETDIKSTAEVVDAYNHALDENKRKALHEWLRAYVKWFTDMKDAYVTAAAIDEYASLIRIVPREPRDKRLIRDVLSSLVQRAEREPVGNRDSTVALSDALQVVDEDVFSEDLEILFCTASVLLSKLDPSKTVFIRETGRAHEATLLALHRVLFLVQLVAPHRLNPGQRGFYQTVKMCLEEISDLSTYLPVTFHAEIAKQTLQLLAQKESMDMFPVLKRCVRGCLYLYSVGRHAMVADINLDAWDTACHELKQAYVSLHSTCNVWYDTLMELNCLAQLVARHAEAQPVFIERFERLMRDQHELSEIQDRKFLAFGIVRQLQILAGDAPVLIRAKAVDEIIQLASTYTVCDTCYGDPTIVEALLDALVHIYISGACCDASEKVLRTMIDDESKQIAVKKWLNGQTIDTKLQQEIADRRRRDSTELFPIVRRAII